MDAVLVLIAVACGVGLFVAPWIVIRWLTGPDKDSSDDDREPVTLT